MSKSLANKESIDKIVKLTGVNRQTARYSWKQCLNIKDAVKKIMERYKMSAKEMRSINTYMQEVPDEEDDVNIDLSDKESEILELKP